MSDTDLRDSLAVLRTRLANERTFLAYARTALALMVCGAALLHFKPDSQWVLVSVSMLVVSGAGVLTFGVYRLHAVQRTLSQR